MSAAPASRLRDAAPRALLLGGVGITDARQQPPVRLTAPLRPAVPPQSTPHGQWVSRRQRKSAIDHQYRCADSNTYFNYGSATYASLAALANITLPGGTHNGPSQRQWHTATGMIMAAAVDLGDAVTLAGSTTLQYSSCAIQQVLSTTSPLVATKGRSWVNMY